VVAAIILAGGLGTRLRSVVPDLPKPMAPIRGRPFLEHQLDYWIGQGVDEFILSVGYRKQAIIDHFGSNYRSTPLSYVIEEKPMGTGGGVLLAAQGLNQPFLILNGDTFFEVDLATLLKFHNERLSDWTFSLFRTGEVGRYMGIEVNAKCEIEMLQSGGRASGYLANGGVYLVNPAVLAKGEFLAGTKMSLEDDFLPALVEKGCKLYGLEFQGAFIDIGVPRDYYLASQVLPHY
jgi:D-glycero-alpha-D-manno-heptose 1-phosphate guanylyltransferase